MHPVDEFAALRTSIRAMEARVEALRQQFLGSGARLRSNQHEVTIRHQTRRVFRKVRLPPAILGDPRLWEDVSQPIVTVALMTEGASHPFAEEEPTLIEPF